jgi:hypothetical protein
MNISRLDESIFLHRQNKGHGYPVPSGRLSTQNNTLPRQKSEMTTLLKMYWLISM